jgi:hypothetical protein
MRGTGADRLVIAMTPGNAGRAKGAGCLGSLAGQPSWSPAAVDRLICQAMAQVLTPVFDPNFHPHGFRFRPGRSRHDAVERARRLIADDADVVR